MIKALGLDMCRNLQTFWTFAVFLLHVKDGQVGPLANFAAGYIRHAREEGL